MSPSLWMETSGGLRRRGCRARRDTRRARRRCVAPSGSALSAAGDFGASQRRRPDSLYRRSVSAGTGYRDADRDVRTEDQGQYQARLDNCTELRQPPGNHDGSA
ncbi:unnamed protein product [Laminaria digitata]